MRRAAALVASLAIASIASTARAQGSPPHLPPPPPPSTAPEYVPPSPPSQIPPPRHEPQPSPPPRRERPSPQPEPAPPPRRYVAPPSERTERDQAPDARTGFQLALRSGLSLPFGSVTGANGDVMSSEFKAQVPLFVEAGAKITPNIFLGGFLQLAFGGTGDDFRKRAGCDNSPRSCLASDFQIGLEGQYHFQPDERIDPWLGLGLAYESATASSTGGGASASENVSGFDFLILSGGADFRVSRVFGIGPFGSLALGQYGHAHAEGNGTVIDQSVANGALHGWLTLGVRVVFFP